MDRKKSWIIFTDGASSGNPGPGGWGAILISPDGHIQELGGSSPYTTNNKMELTSAIEALQRTRDHHIPVEVYTDSTYVIRGITQWIRGWKAKGWISAEGNPVANVDLWQKLDSLSRKSQTTWHHVRGHAGIAGNERADEIAVAFSKGNPISLFNGQIENYSIPILDFSKNPTPLKQNSSKSSTSKKAYSYLSCIDGKPLRHKTWAECEKRVRGHSGAKFRKTANAQDEEAILRSWGFSPSDLKN